MKPNGKRTWNDPLVDEANLSDTPAKKKLAEWLHTIVECKNSPIPREILEEVERVKREVHFMWTFPNPIMAATAEFFRGMAKEMRREKKEEKLISFLEAQIPRLEKMRGGDFEAHLRSGGMEIRPHLSSYESLNEFDSYLWRLIPKLMDADWVEALRICPGPKCKKLIMSNAKWERKFCSETCKNRFWGRKNRERDREDGPKGKSEKIRRVCLKCNRSFWANGKFNRICPACTEENNKGG